MTIHLLRTPGKNRSAPVSALLPTLRAGWVGLLALLLLTLLAGCTPQPATENSSSPAPSDSANSTSQEESKAIQFTPVTEQAGIHFKLGHNGKTPLTILETSGGGCACLDYDNDDWPDILLVGPYNVALYHNLHNGTFRDV